MNPQFYFIFPKKASFPFSGCLTLCEKMYDVKLVLVAHKTVIIFLKLLCKLFEFEIFHCFDVSFLEIFRVVSVWFLSTPFFFQRWCFFFGSLPWICLDYGFQFDFIFIILFVLFVEQIAFELRGFTINSLRFLKYVFGAFSCKHKKYDT